MEDRPPPNPAKLLAQWMEWETGETPPGRVIANMKTGGLRELLEALVADGDAGSALSLDVDSVDAGSWTPIV